LDWKWTLNFFDLIFRPSTPSRQKVNVPFFISLIFARMIGALS
jgi:hypothetical protein